MDKKDREYIREVKRADLKKHKIIYNKFGDETYRSSKLFDDTTVTEGGWYWGRKWMTAKFIIAAENRWVQHSYETGKEQPDYKDWIAHQCGGCRYFAALDLDYGICCDEYSTNDGRVTFEHGGCIKHSDFEL